MTARLAKTTLELVTERSGLGILRAMFVWQDQATLGGR
jgi:hypothetical protein